MTRCGICGWLATGAYVGAWAPNGHDPAKHELFRRMHEAPGVIEPLSPLRKDIQTAKESEAWARRVSADRGNPR